MIDNISILLTHLAVVWVVLRAVQLDLLTPWFGGGTKSEDTGRAPDASRPARQLRKTPSRPARRGA